MSHATFNVTSHKDLHTTMGPNRWDLLAFFLVAVCIVLLARGGHDMTLPYHFGDPIHIHLTLSHLPYYAYRSVLRMLIAISISLLSALLFGYAAAKSRLCERLIIPAVDILQSVPVLGFLSISIWGFVSLFPNSIFGVECAAIFAIYTSQVWNMILSIYQSIKTLPVELHEAADVYQLSSWKRFWRIELPFALPSLLWNIMVSMSAGWFFVVASEAISVSHQQVLLPGLGSYIAEAVAHINHQAVTGAVLTMGLIIWLYQLVVFEPMGYYAEKFRIDYSPDRSAYDRPIVVKIFHKARMLRQLGRLIPHACQWIARALRLKKSAHDLHIPEPKKQSNIRWIESILMIMLLYLAGEATYYAANYIVPVTTKSMVLETLLLGLLTGLRVMLLVFLSALVWLPVGVWIGRRPFVTRFCQPIIQFLASFPANLIYPIIGATIIKYHLNVDVWSSPLIILGTQWYILFNVIAGAQSIPSHLIEVADLMQVKGLNRWRQLWLPSLFPFLITGMMTAAGGAWNASIVAEAISWGHHTLYAHGLGAYIVQATVNGNYHQQALGIVVMCAYVIIINVTVWQPLYDLAAKRFRLG